VNFKEAMSEMIDGKTCLSNGMEYRLYESEIQKRLTSMGNWSKSIRSTSEHIYQSWSLAKRSIIIDGKTIELSEESYNKLKESLL